MKYIDILYTGYCINNSPSTSPNPPPPPPHCLLPDLPKSTYHFTGVARGGRGGICPRAPPGGGRQNHVKEFFKIYILRNFEKSERVQ